MIEIALKARMIIRQVNGEPDKVRKLYEEYKKATWLHTTIREILEWKKKSA